MKKITIDERKLPCFIEVIGRSGKKKLYRLVNSSKKLGVHLQSAVEINPQIRRKLKPAC